MKAVCYLNSYGIDFEGGVFHFQHGKPASVAPMTGVSCIFFLHRNGSSRMSRTSLRFVCVCVYIYIIYAIQDNKINPPLPDTKWIDSLVLLIAITLSGLLEI